MTRRGQFPREDFAHVAELLREYSTPKKSDVENAHGDIILRACLSNNLNLILDALDIAARATDTPPAEETQP